MPLKQHLERNLRRARNVPSRLADRALWLHDRLRGIERIHLLHIGKTGGTALKQALKDSGSERRRFLLHVHGTTLARIPRGDRVVLFVRDPVSRFVSAFYGRQREDRPRYHFPWRPGEAKAFARFDSPNALALALSSTDPALASAAVDAMRSIQHIRYSYWTWLRSEAYLRKRRRDILFVGSQENFDEDVGRLSAILAMPVRLPSDDVGAHRNPPRGKALEEAAVRNLLAWYRRDYECLMLLRQWFPHLPDYGSRLALLENRPDSPPGGEPLIAERA